VESETKRRALRPEGKFCRAGRASRGLIMKGITSTGSLSHISKTADWRGGEKERQVVGGA